LLNLIKKINLICPLHVYSGIDYNSLDSKQNYYILLTFTFSLKEL